MFQRHIKLKVFEKSADTFREQDLVSFPFLSYCQNPNSTTTQPNITKTGFDLKMTLNHPPPQQTQCQQYLSCFWPGFDETLKVASWELLEQIPTSKLTFVQAIFVLATFVHIRNISAVTDPILTKL